MRTRQWRRADIQRILEILNQGGIVAIPTDTVYGLAVRSDLKEAVKRLEAIRQNPAGFFPLMVAGMDQIEREAQLTERDRKLIDRWMPGPLTLIFHRRTEKGRSQNQADTVAFRMPDDEFNLELIRRTGVPLTVTSACIGSGPVCVRSEAVLEQLEGLIDAVVSGESGADRLSTVCDATGPQLKILRTGPIRLEHLESDE